MFGQRECDVGEVENRRRREIIVPSSGVCWQMKIISVGKTTFWLYYGHLLQNFYGKQFFRVVFILLAGQASKDVPKSYGLSRICFPLEVHSLKLENCWNDLKAWLLNYEKLLTCQVKEQVDTQTSNISGIYVILPRRL